MLGCWKLLWLVVLNLNNQGYFFNSWLWKILSFNSSVEVLWVNAYLKFSVWFNNCHHGVDPVRWLAHSFNTPRHSILFNSSFSFDLNLTGTLRGGCTTGWWVGSSWIWHSTPVMHPRPEKESAYLRNVLLSSVSTLWTSFISVLAERPRTLETLSKTSNSMGQIFLCVHITARLDQAIWVDVHQSQRVLHLTSWGVGNLCCGRFLMT